MTLNEITGKIIRYNRSAGFLLGVSVCFAVSMIGAYGILLFSPVITGVLMTDGSTYLISLGMYILTMIAVVVFLFYANSIYTQSQMGETGVFLSLGLPIKAVGKIRSRQLGRTVLTSGVLGLALAVPFSFGLWLVLTRFLTYTERSFTIGWNGLWAACGLWLFLWAALLIRNAYRLSKLDIMEILHSSAECAEVKASRPVLGIVGLAAVPAGLVLFNLAAVTVRFKRFSMLFLGISLAGIYLISAQVTSAGSLAKRFFPKEYRRNLLFYNLVKQKGNQYTPAMFVSSLLIALTVFCVCFNGCSMMELYYQIEEDPFDYAVLVPKGGLSEKEIRSFADESGISLSDWKTLEVLLIGREHQYEDPARNEWSCEFAVKASDFNELSGLGITVPDSGYYYFQDSSEAMFQTCSGETGRFYNPAAQEEFELKKYGLISKENVVNDSAQIDSFAIFSDAAFEKISGGPDSAYQLNYYLFNGGSPENSNKLQEHILNETVRLSGGEMFINYQDSAVKDMYADYQEVIVPYEGNELFAARRWVFYPFARQTQLAVQTEAGAVYLLLIFFIAVLSFVFAVMIMSLKIAGTVLQDQESYKRAVYLGLKERDLRKLIRKQAGLVFFFPSLCGCAAASLMVNRFMKASSVKHVLEVTWLAVGISCILLLLQIAVYMILQKKLAAKACAAIYKTGYSA